MLVKLSGDKYIESTHITGIDKYTSFQWEWIVYTIDGHEWLLTKQQFNELMDCLPIVLPTPAMSIKQGSLT